jgi:phage shock protein PspC (stress-responsive transcriptional regulator)
MKKTVTANIGGMMFNIDEDAYELLNQYLQKIKSYFKASEGRDDIMMDIESRIAEMFNEKSKNSTTVINIDDVKSVIAVMGNPEDYVDEETAKSKKSFAGDFDFKSAGSKRLYRDKDNSIFGGVCSGVGHYFGLDPVFLRLAFAISFFAWGSGFLFYLLLWFIIPEAKTTAEKLEMKGEKVNIDNISKAIEDEMNNLKKKFKKEAENFNTNAHTSKVKSFFNEIVGFFIQLFQMVFKAFGKVIGGIAIAIGMIFLVIIIATLTNPGSAFFQFGNVQFSFSQLYAYYDFIDKNSLNQQLIIVSISMIIGLLAIGFIINGVKVLFNSKIKLRKVNFGLTILWIIGVILLGASSLSLVSNFKEEASNEEVIELVDITSDTLVIVANEDVFKMNKRKRYQSKKRFSMLKQGDSFYLGNVYFDIQKSKNNQYSLKVEKYARGANDDEADDMAKIISYEFNVSANELFLNPYFTLDVNDVWRNQGVYLTLYVPEGKSVFLTDGMERIIFDIDNVSDTYDSKMVDKTWTMLKPGLTCISCNLNEF